MAYQRYHTASGQDKEEGVQVGPNGRRLCRVCKQEVPRGRKTLCGDECKHQWNLNASASYLRHHVFKRDKGTCALCGLDCVAMVERLTAHLAKMALHRSRHQQRRRLRGRQIPSESVYGWRSRFLVRYGGRKLAAVFPRTLWEADHITPVVEGGGLTGLEGVRTLCWRCHVSETAALRKRMALARKDSQGGREDGQSCNESESAGGRSHGKGNQGGAGEVCGDVEQGR